MKRLAISIMSLLVVLFLAGCSNSVAQNLITIDDVPQNANLIYTHDTGFETGFVHTYGTWETTDVNGYFVFEMIVDKGSLKGVTVVGNKPDGGNDSLANLGDITGNVIFSTTNINIQDSGYVNYSMRINQISDFDGLVNVYFVPH